MSRPDWVWPGPDATQRVLEWGLPRLRDLPWRRTRDPWAILVSEVMLQQTQVSRVIPKWLAFMELFPTPAACAATPLGDVLREWQGLGYPRRARNLHGAATTVVERGAFPDTLAGLLQLPGVGAYTARAILAFAYDIDAAVVDTNIARIYARVAGTRLTLNQVQQLADAALPLGRSWEWNQSLMDLGATLCRPTAARCDECPLETWCSWRGLGDDPAPGSAAVSAPQSRFEGSDRQARGRLMKRLGDGSITLDDAAAVMGRDAVRAKALVDGLLADRLVEITDGRVSLPS